MNNKFESLDCDDDVLSFAEPEQTFKLGNFRGRVRQQLRSKLVDNYSIAEGFGFITIEGRQICSSHFNWQSILINCELLRLGAKSWKKGKLRITVNLERIPDANYNQIDQKIKIQQVCLEFCSDDPEIPKPESPLDDLRQQMISSETQP